MRKLNSSGSEQG